MPADDDRTPLPDAASDPTLAAPAGRSPARTIGRYELRTELGAGGMGLVYRAWDPQLAREVAIKVVRDDTDADGAPRLLREARAMAKVRHANVIAVHDAGPTDDNGVYVVMELVADGTLAQWFATAPPWRDAIAKCRAAGDGLAAAHLVGLVHRDFKPHNVLLDGDRVLVADFGLARSQPGIGDATSALTASGALVGTPAYMAPEQLLGEEVGVAADQFALAATAFEGIYGVRPFAASTLAALVALHLESRIAAAPADRGVPAAVHAVLVRGLARKPGDRYASVADFTRALGEAASTGAVAPIALAKPRAHFPWALAAGALAAAALSIALTIHFWPARSAPRPSPPISSAPPAPAIPPKPAATHQDLAHFHPDEQFLDPEAKAWQPDATLETELIGTFGPDGTLDLTSADSYATWIYLSETVQATGSKRCQWSVMMKAGARLAAGSEQNANCGDRKIAGHPRCTIKQILGHARRDGFDLTRPTEIMFGIIPGHIGPWWRYMQHDKSKDWVDNCDTDPR